MLRQAAARHEVDAQRFSMAGRADAAERALEAARRSYDAVEHSLRAGGERAASLGGPAESGRPDAGGALSPVVSTDAGEEVARLREGLATLLSWAGGANLDEVERRRAWSEAIVERCGGPDWRGWMQAVCDVAASALPSLRGVAVTITSGSGAEFVAASDSPTFDMHEVELIVGEGPSRTARDQDRVVVVADLADEREAWPGLTSTDTHHVRGVSALPIRLHGLCVGSLTLYHAGPLASDSCRSAPQEATAFAEMAAAALIAELEELRNGGPVGNEQFIVHVAAGAMAARANIRADEAESRLRAFAFSAGLSLAEVAQRVLDGGQEIL